MTEASAAGRRQVVPLEPKRLGLGEVFYRTREAVVVAEAGSGRIVLWNDSARDLFGYTADEAIGLLVEDLVPEPLKDRHRSGLSGYAREGRGALIDSGSTVELPAVGKDGGELWVEMSLTPLDPGGLPGRYALAIVRDITARKRLEAEVHAAREELSVTVAQLERRAHELALINELGDLLHACKTTEEAGAVISDVAGRLFPHESGALYLYSPSRDVLDSTSSWGTDPPAEHSLAPEDCWALRRGRVQVVDAPGSGAICAHARDAGPHLCAPMVAQGETLGVLHLRTAESQLSSFSSELATAVAGHLALALANFRLRETLRNQSIRDPLTNLYNRRYMEESIEREVRRANRHGLPLAVIALDIDHFKAFNDAYGHEAGDLLLRELATFLHAHVRGEDVVCRMGGEEFLAILPYATVEQAAARAEELRAGANSVRVLPPSARVEQSVTISLGVAACPEHGTTADELLRAADAALYRAKAAGRDRVALAHPR